MELYEYKYAVKVSPGRNAEEAQAHFMADLEIKGIEKSDFKLLVPHEDFVKLFRLARTLYEVDQYTPEDISTLVSTYANILGYTLSNSDIWHGILKWAERLSDSDDEDIEDWLN